MLQSADGAPQFMVEEYNHAVSEVTLHSEWHHRDLAIDAFLELVKAHGLSARYGEVAEGLRTNDSVVRTVGNYGLSISKAI